MRELNWVLIIALILSGGFWAGIGILVGIR